jgi:hypothetical protein
MSSEWLSSADITVSGILISACTRGSSDAQNFFGSLEDADVDPPLAAPPFETSGAAADASPPHFAARAAATMKIGIAMA